MVKLSLSGNTIYLRLLAMKGFNAIQPGLNCFISMILSVASCCGFSLYTWLSLCYIRPLDKHILINLS